MARLSEYDPAIAADLCQRISTETISLRAICDSEERFPNVSTFYRWMLNHSELRELYARSKTEQLQILADEIVPLADQDRICEKVTIKADGSREVVILDQVERSKLMIDSRKWLLSKLDPKRFGERVQNEHTGENGGPIAFEVRTKSILEEPEKK
jgi:hypothetical protein